MASRTWRRVAAGAAAAMLTLTTLGSGATSAAETTITPTTLCGPLDGPVFELGLIDPEPVETVSISAIGLDAADFDLATLAVFELAWVAGTDVCVDLDELAQPVGAEAQVRACGDVVGGATTWLFEMGSGVIDENGVSDMRRGFIHDTLLGFVFLDHTTDPEPPNILTAIEVAVDRPTAQDCIDTAVSWHAPERPQVSARLATLGCMVTDRVDDRLVQFSHPVELSTYVFPLTPGSSVEPGLDLGLVTGFVVSAERGLEGAVTIAPIALDWCEAGIHGGGLIDPDTEPGAYYDEPTPGPTRVPTPSPTVAPTPSATPVAPTPVAAMPVSSPGTVAIASGSSEIPVAAGQASPRAPDASPAADRSSAAVPALIAAMVLAGVAAVVAWRVILLRRSRRAVAADEAWWNGDVPFGDDVELDAWMRRDDRFER